MDGPVSVDEVAEPLCQVLLRVHPWSVLKSSLKAFWTSEVSDDFWEDVEAAWQPQPLEVEVTGSYPYTSHSYMSGL